MNIVVISTASLLTPPTDYGGMELQAYLLTKGLEERGHRVGLIAKHGSYYPNGGLIGVDKEEEIPSVYDGVDADVIIDMSHNKTMSHAYPNLPIIEQYQVMSMTGIRKNPVLISKGQRDTKFPGLKCEIVYQHIDLNAYDANTVLSYPYFLTMAQIIEEKRIDWSIEVALRTGYRLKVFGPWWGNPKYMDSLRTAAMANPQIDLRGPIGGEEKRKTLSNAKALLHFPGAGEFCEAGSIITLEALASGTPVIVSDNGVHREYVTDGYNGYVVNSVGEAVDIIQSGKVDAIDRVNCRKSVEWAHYPAMAEQYEKLCERVVRGETW